MKRLLTLSIIPILFFSMTGCRVDNSTPPDLPQNTPTTLIEESTQMLPLTEIVPASTETVGSTPTPHEILPTPGPLGSINNPIIVSAYPGNLLFSDEQKWYIDFAAALSQLTSMTVQVVKPTTFLEMVEGLGTGDIHIARMLPLDYVVAHAQGYVHMAFKEEYPDLYAIQFLANPDAGFTPSQDKAVALGQFQNRTPCWMRQLADVGYVLPLGILQQAGISTAPPLFVTDLPDMARAIYERRCDFGAVYDVDLLLSEYMVLQDLSDIDQKVIPIYVSEGLVPTGGNISYSSSLPAALQKAFTEAFLKLASTPKGLETLNLWLGGTARLAVGEDALYGPFREAAYATELDLKALLASPYYLTDIEPVSQGQWVTPPQDTLVIDVFPQGGAPFLPFMDNANGALNRLVLPAIYAELARMDAAGHYFPYLAASLPGLENGLIRFVGTGEDEQLEIEFLLRPDLQWQDGQPLTAEDLVFSWELVMQPEWPGFHWGMNGFAPEVYVASVEAVSPDRVVYRFLSEKQAREAAQTGYRLKDPSFYENLREQVGPVVPLDYLDVGRNVFPQHLLADLPASEIAASDFARRPIFAGAYRLVEGGGDGEPVVVKAFGEFFAGIPEIARVVFGASYYAPAAEPYWQTPDLLAEAFSARAIHAQLGLPAVKSREGADPHAYQNLAVSGLANVIWEPRDSWEVLDFNLDNPHLADLRVRQAIALALDREALMIEALGGYGSPIHSYLPAWHPLFAGDDLLPHYAYDPEQARLLLQEAGYDLGTFPAIHPTRGPLVLRLTTMDVIFYSRQGIAALIQNALAAIGIQVEIQFYKFTEFEGEDCQAIRNGRQFDLAMAAWVGASDPYPSRWVERITASWSIPTPENGCPLALANWPGWQNARVDEIIPLLKDDRLALEQPEVYRALWREHQLLWATELPSLPLFIAQRPVAVVPQLVGVLPSPFAFEGGVEDTWNIFEWTLETR